MNVQPHSAGQYILHEIPSCRIAGLGIARVGVRILLRCIRRLYAYRDYFRTSVWLLEDAGLFYAYHPLDLCHARPTKKAPALFREQALSCDVLYDFQQDLVHVLRRPSCCPEFITETEHGANQQPLLRQCQFQDVQMPIKDRS